MQALRVGEFWWNCGIWEKFPLQSPELGGKLRPVMVCRALFVCLPIVLLASSCSKETQVERANREGILIVGNSNEPKGLDSQVVTGVLESNIMRALFEGLVSDHPSDDAVTIPAGAEELLPDEKATVWTAKLRQDAKWSDGAPVTAHDYAFAYQRILSPEFAAKYAEMLYFLQGADRFNRSLLGSILFLSNEDPVVPGEVAKGINFAGEKELDLKPLGEDPKWDELKSDVDRVLFLRSQGLDQLDKGQLEWVGEDPHKRFAWPEGVTPEMARHVIERMLEHIGKDLWDLANVGVEVVDDFTLRLTLRGPTPYFPQILKHYTWNPVPRHVVLLHGTMTQKGNPWAKLGNIVSNGPYQLKSWRRTDHLEVERNPHYWNASEVTLNGVRFLPIRNSYTEARMFRDGQLHTTYTAPPEIVDLMLKENPSVLRQEPYVGTLFIRCNTTRKTLDDVRVRRALSLSINQKDICNKILRGYLPAHGMTPPMAGYDTPHAVSFDPDEGRRLLAEAGFPGGKGFPRFKYLIASSGETAATVAQAIQAMWRKELGIEVEIENREWTAYLAAMQELDYDLAGSGWIGDYLDPLTFIEMWTEGNGNNLTGWSNQRFQDLLAQSHQEADPARRYGILREAETILTGESPVLLVAWYARNYLIHPSVENWHPLLLDNHPYDVIRLRTK
jgi:oligopeptide transport system substrate-binding protein